MNWQQAMLEGLLEAREAGELDFARAWRRARRRAERLGVSRPRDFLRGSDGDPGYLPFSSFFRRACEREWRGVVRTDYQQLPELVGDSGLVVERSSSRGSERVTLLA